MRLRLIDRTLHFLGGLLVLTTMSRPLGAQQSVVVVDLGLTAAHFEADDASAVGPSLRVSLAGTRGHLFGSAEGGGLATFGAATGFATLEGGVRSSTRSGWRTELAGELASVVGSSTAGGARTALVGGRTLWTTSTAGGWLRAIGHASQRLDASLTGAGIEAGTWKDFARAQLSATVTQEWTHAELFTGAFRTGFVGTTPVRYTEGAIALHTESDRSSFDVSASTRRAAGASRLFEQSVNASVAYWPRKSMALVFSVARQLADFIRGADGADALSIGLRFGQASPVMARNARFIAVVQVSDSSGAHVLRVHAPGAHRVDVMGDFTEWEAQPLALTGAVFQRVLTLSSGTHRMLVRIDGGAWRPATNTPVVDDDLGGRVGLLVVP
ncbi:MAG: glycogen-binding domain-containing protein [bacterium]